MNYSFKSLLNHTVINSVLLLIYLFVINFLIFGNEDKITAVVLTTIITFIFALAAYNISRFLFYGFLILSIIVLIPYYVSIQLFGSISYANIAALYFTDSTESLSYIRSLPIISILKSILLIAPLALFFKLKLPKIKVKLAVAMLLSISAYMGLKVVTQWDYFMSQKDYNYLYRYIYISPLRVITQFGGTLYLVEKDIKRQDALQKLPSNWDITKHIAGDKITVFIVGESVRKDFLQIYNSKLSNTPFLNSVNKIQFNNSISYGAHTIQSLTHAFQSVKKDNLYFPNNVITLANTAGLSTYWLSNQGLVGSHDSDISAMAKTASFTQFVSKGSFGTSEKDEKILDLFNDKLTADKKVNSVYFLHTIGSHPSPCDITDGEYTTFIKSKAISCYIESIKRTDAFIKRVYETLKTKNQKFQIVYFSDHGLQITEDHSVIHHEDYKQNYEVPLLIIDSELKENIYVNQQRNLKDFLLLYHELLNIETSNIKKDYKFISEDKAPSSNELYNHKKFENLKDNSINL